MILSMLGIRCRDDWDAILLEDVLLFIRFGIRWLSWSQGYR